MAMKNNVVPNTAKITTPRVILSSGFKAAASATNENKLLIAFNVDLYNYIKKKVTTWEFASKTSERQTDVEYYLILKKNFCSSLKEQFKNVFSGPPKEGGIPNVS